VPAQMQSGAIEMVFTFTLKYQYQLQAIETDALIERLAAVGCDDALVGVGQPGHLGLEFTRKASSAEEAVESALADIRRVVPGAKLISLSL